MKRHPMKIIKNLKVPTGNILIVEGDKGKLEMLSIGDYSKEVNLKCDALNLSHDIEPVKHTSLLPLEDKWVITISTQYGCSMRCNFCDVPWVGPGLNASTRDLVRQVITGLSIHPNITTNRLNIHYARMGEPTWNSNVLTATYILSHRLPSVGHKIHPVVSTMMPKKNKFLPRFIKEWMHIKNNLLNGEAGLQLSINSTNEEEREKMFYYNAHTLEDISKMMKKHKPEGRKITLNFAVADYEIDAKKLRKLFNPKRYIVKLTPMHKTNEAVKNGIETEGDYTTMYPYKHIEEDLKSVGFDVLVFIASEYEDLSRITCGNAILSVSLPDAPYEDLGTTMRQRMK